MSKNLIIEVLAPLALSLITFVALWGKAILGQHKQRMVWRIGVGTGTVFSLFSAIGFIVPFQLYPCTSYMFGLTFMSCCILYSAYNQPVSETMTAEELQDLKDGKVTFLQQMAMGAGFILFIMVLAGFTAGQREGRIVNESVASAVNRISMEVSSLSRRLGLVETSVKTVQSKVDSSAKFDTVGREKVYKGQADILKQMRKRK